MQVNKGGDLENVTGGGPTIMGCLKINVSVCGRLR